MTQPAIMGLLGVLSSFMSFFLFATFYRDTPTHVIPFSYLWDIEPDIATTAQHTFGLGDLHILFIV